MRNQSISRLSLSQVVFALPMTSGWPMILVLVGLITTVQASDISTEPYWDLGFKAVYQEAKTNLKKPSKKNPYFHAEPASKFKGVYLWDSAFIALIWKHKDLNVAKDIIRSVLHNQLPDGRIPHVVHFGKKSPLTQPPLLSWAVVQLLEAKPDAAFASEVYPALRRYHQWLWQSRRLANGLFFWQHTYESGMDNSPRFSNRDESKMSDTRQIAAVDFSAYMVADAEALATMAASFGLEAESAEYQEHARLVKDKMNQLLWDQASGYYYDLDIRSDKFIKIPAISSFASLFAGVADQNQAQQLLEHLLNPQEFATPIPFPTVARNHSEFEKDCWRGPVWINMAYLVIQGMKRYGFKQAAITQSQSLVDGVYKTWANTGAFVEYYDPDRFDFKQLSRKKGEGLFSFFSASRDPWKILMHLVGKQLYLGQKPVSHFIGWTGLVNNLAIEELDFKVQN